MADFDTEAGATRDDLVQRVALIEAMVTEGRRTTMRYGWMFLMWGLVYLVAMGWTVFLPAGRFAWPICITVGVAITIVVRVRQKRSGGTENLKSRSVGAVWPVMGTAVTLFVITAAVTHHTDSAIYVAAIMFMVGMAHGVSAWILRWAAQGMAAAVWWICGMATLIFTTAAEIVGIYLAASFFGMVLFGLYTMMLERRRSTPAVQQHA